MNSSVIDRMLSIEKSWYLMIAQDLGWMKESILAVGVFAGRIMNVESIKCTFNNESIKILQCLTYLLNFLKVVHPQTSRSFSSVTSPSAKYSEFSSSAHFVFLV